MRGGLTLLWGVPSVLKGRGGEAVNPPPTPGVGWRWGGSPPWVRPPLGYDPPPPPKPSCMGGSPFSAGGCGGSSGPPQPIPRWRMGMCRPPPNKKMPSLWGGSSLTAGITPEPPGGAQLSPPPQIPRYGLEMGTAPPPPDPLCGGPHSVQDAPGRGASSDPPHPPGIAWRWAVPPHICYVGVPILCTRLRGGGKVGPPPPSLQV